uniref:Uncharacterized protein n=1 Tax=Arundo donax TaxID=35708 RepID=A0A0A8Y5T8_ARUDO
MAHCTAPREIQVKSATTSTSLELGGNH